MDASSKVVQHINKKSSDELLRKFADDDDDAPAQAPVGRELVRVSKRRKRSGPNSREVPLLNVSGGASSLVVVERKRAASRRSGLLRQLGIGRSQLRGREIRNKSLFCTIQKTWRRTVEGASRVLMEKQYYNRHKRLINDAV